MTGDERLAQLAREVDRTRQEYVDAKGEERNQCWRLHQRALTNYNKAVEQSNLVAKQA